MTDSETYHKTLNKFEKETDAIGVNPEHRDDFTALNRALLSTSGFQMIFMEFNDHPYRGELIDLINSTHDNSTVLEITMDEYKTIDDFFDKVCKLSEIYKIIHVTNLETWIFADDKGYIITGFNYRREAFPEKCKATLLMWMTESDIRRFATEAPDMWAWRSAVFSFDIVKERPKFEPSKEYSFLDNLPVKDRVKRLNEILVFLKNPPSNLTPSLKTSLLFEIGDIYRSLDMYNEANEYYNKCLKIHEDIGDRNGIAKSLNSIGLILRVKGRLDEALNMFEKNLKILEDIGDKNGISVSLNNIGLILQNKGKLDEALSKYQQSLEIAEEIKDRKGFAISLNNIGFILQDRGKLDEALNKYQQSLKIQQEIDNRQDIAVSLNNIGRILHEKGMLDEALNQYEQCLKIREEIGDKQGIATTLNNIGNILRDKGKLNDALDKYEHSLKIREGIGDKDSIANSFNNIGGIYYYKKDYINSLKYFLRSSEIQIDMGTKRDETVNSIKTIKPKLEPDQFNKIIKTFGIGFKSKLEKYIGEPIFTKPQPPSPKKPQRNEPCPCGSGKKYKKCHGA
jgi:tetratricopeptide (TPR) repeat protein